MTSLAMKGKESHKKKWIFGLDANEKESLWINRHLLKKNFKMMTPISNTLPLSHIHTWSLSYTHKNTLNLCISLSQTHTQTLSLSLSQDLEHVQRVHSVTHAHLLQLIINCPFFTRIDSFSFPSLFLFVDANAVVSSCLFIYLSASICLYMSLLV